MFYAKSLFIKQCSIVPNVPTFTLRIFKISRSRDPPRIVQEHSSFRSRNQQSTYIEQQNIIYLYPLNPYRTRLAECSDHSEQYGTLQNIPRVYPNALRNNPINNLFSGIIQSYFGVTRLLCSTNTSEHKLDIVQKVWYTIYVSGNFILQKPMLYLSTNRTIRQHVGKFTEEKENESIRRSPNLFTNPMRQVSLPTHYSGTIRPSEGQGTKAYLRTMR